MNTKDTVMFLQIVTCLKKALLSRDESGLENAIRDHLSGSISYFDNKEDFYHGFLLGLLRPLQAYRVVSNRESGNGRPDILLKPYDERRPAVVLEIKHVDKYTDMEAGCEEALKQIEDQKYDTELLEDGYRNILKYGVCFCKKSCMVRLLKKE